MRKILSLFFSCAMMTCAVFAADQIADTSNMRSTVYKAKSDGITVVNNFKFSGWNSGAAYTMPVAGGERTTPVADVQTVKNMQYQPVRYNRRKVVCGAWYVGGRANLSMLSWKNEYSTMYPYTDEEFNSDKYSFEPVFGGALTVGYAFDTAWRLDVEAGVLGRFEDNDEGFNFSLTVPYIMANAYSDFYNGVYIGVGLGLAVPKTELDGIFFEGGYRTKRHGSLMGAAMVGYAYDLDEHLTLDIRYRLSAFDGTKHMTAVVDAGGTSYDFRNKIGLILDNSVSLGLRYRF